AGRAGGGASGFTGRFERPPISCHRAARSTRYRHLGISLKLPLPLDMEPMLSAISDSGIPKGDGWEYEPKWDGFRTLVFRDGEEVALMSRGGRAMTRYFPEGLPAC